MEKDCRETFESEFQPRGFSMEKDGFGYYASPNTDFAFRGWEAAWKYDEVRRRIFNGTPHYATTYYFEPKEGFRFRIDNEGICHHEEIAKDISSNKSGVDE